MKHAILVSNPSDWIATSLARLRLEDSGYRVIVAEVEKVPVLLEQEPPLVLLIDAGDIEAFRHLQPFVDAYGVILLRASYRRSWSDYGDWPITSHK